MKAALVILAILFGVVGIGGTGAGALGCVFALLALYVQAGERHEETLKALAHLGAIRANTRETVLVLRKAHNVTEEEVEPVKAPAMPGPQPRAPRPYTPGNFYGPHPK